MSRRRTEGINYRRLDWVDTETLQIRYGIQAKPYGLETRKCRWMHCIENGRLVVYHTEAKREAKLRELKGLKPVKTVTSGAPAEKTVTKV
jgi:hypothetical protein